MNTSQKKFEIRAQFDEQTITVYQAYNKSIAIPASQHNSFLAAPFTIDRMTWIKPSFLWMMYRSQWTQRANQERILAIKIKRNKWDEALTKAILTTPEKRVYNDTKKWRKSLEQTEIRVQWDPERDIHLNRLNYSSIQVGLTKKVTEDFIKNWITEINDITPAVHQIYNLYWAKKFNTINELLPQEEVYPCTDFIKKQIGMD